MKADFGGFDSKAKLNQSGQAVTEYILLLAIVTTLTGFMFRGLLSSVRSGTLYLGGQLEKDLKTGSARNTIFVDQTVIR